MLKKHDLNAIKVIKKIIKKTLKKSKSKNKVKNFLNLVLLPKSRDKIDSTFFVFNVKMHKNQRYFTETEINVKLS